MKHMLTWLCFSLLATLATAQLQDPLSHGYYCDTEPSVYTDWVNPIGTTKVLWIMCAPDSGALRPLDSLSILRPDTCPPRQRVRVMYPSTYRLPTWARDLFDSNQEKSLTSYFLDQSRGRFRVVGNVVGRDSTHIFTCDPDTSVRHYRSNSATCFAIAGAAVKPGDSMPMRLRRPGRPRSLSSRM